MDWPDRLDQFPYVRVRIACPWCKRRGDYALTGLAARYGATADLYDVLLGLTQGCRYQRRLKGKDRPKYAPKCGARFIDLWDGVAPDMPQQD